MPLAVSLHLQHFGIHDAYCFKYDDHVHTKPNLSLDLANCKQMTNVYLSMQFDFFLWIQGSC